MVLCEMYHVLPIVVQCNLSNLTCTGIDILCRNRQCVRSHSVKHTENCPKGMKINVG